MDPTTSADNVLCKQHESLADYRFRFLHLQIELSLSTGQVKFAKTLTKKTTVELHHDYPSEIGWLYRFQLLFIHICQTYEKDYSSASAAVGDMIIQAKNRGHRQLSWALCTTRARLAILKGDTELATSIISSLASDFNLPMTDAEIKEEDVKLKSYSLTHCDPELQNLPLPLLLQFLVLLCIHQTNAGQTTAARQNIRRAQFLLDQKAPNQDVSDGRVTVR